MTVLDNFLLTLGRSIPRVRGHSRLIELLKKIYFRKIRESSVVEVQNFKLLLDYSTNVGRGVLFRPDDYQREEFAFINANLDRGGNFVDIGANIGAYSLFVSKLVGFSGKIVGVEASPTVYEHLVRNVEINCSDNIRLYNIGVADINTTLDLIVHPSNFAGSSFINKSNSDSVRTVQVDCWTLMRVLEESNLDAVDMLKIDIEGYEFRVLKSFFMEAPTSLYPKFVITEFHPYLTKKSEGDVLKLLTSIGYVVRHNNKLNYFLERNGLE